MISETSDSSEVGNREAGNREARGSDACLSPGEASDRRRPPGSRSFAVGRYATLIVFLLVVGVFSLARPEAFPTISNFQSIISQGAVLTIIAGGLTVCLILSDFDLSIGAAASLGGVLVAWLLLEGNFTVPSAIVMTMAVGVLVGLVNGIAVVVFRVSAFIATLAMSSVLIGITFAFSEAKTLFGLQPAFLQIARGRFLGISLTFVYAVIIIVILWLWLRSTQTGRYMYAIGGNEEAAALAGVNIKLYRMVAFVISGTLATSAGILITARSGSAFSLAGNDFLLPAFAAAFLGATMFREGRFHVVGTALGVFLLNVIQTGLTMIRVPFYVPNLVQGGILLAAVALSSALRRRQLQ